MALELLRSRPRITDEELALALGIARPAAARFWRLKAQVLLEEEEALHGVKKTT